DILLPVALPEVLYKRDPTERRELEDGGCDQNGDANSVSTNQFFFKWRARPESQSLFVRQFIQADIFRRRQVGPMQPAGLQILAGVADQFEKCVVCLRYLIELAGYNARDGRFGRKRPYPRAATAQLFVAFVTIAEVSHDSGKTL